MSKEAPEDSMEGQQLDLLFVTGDRIHLTLDEQFYADCGFNGETAAEYRVGDLRNYIYENWTSLVAQKERHGSESLENITAKPEMVEQIQLLHLGQRLDPNDLLSTLNLKLSHVIHVVIKPVDLATAEANTKRFDRLASTIKAKAGGKRRGSTSNTPVPAFVSSRSGSVSGTPVTPTIPETGPFSPVQQQTPQSQSSEVTAGKEDYVDEDVTQHVDEIAEQGEPEGLGELSAQEQSAQETPAESAALSVPSVGIAASSKSGSSAAGSAAGSVAPSTDARAGASDEAAAAEVASGPANGTQRARQAPSTTTTAPAAPAQKDSGGCCVIM